MQAPGSSVASASGGVDVAELDKRISGLGKRQFVLHTTRGDEPRIVTSRWAMSYLAGPLSKQQVERLSGEKPPVEAESTSPGPAPDHDTVAVPPAIAAGIPSAYLDPAAAWSSQVGADPTSNRYRPIVAATVNLRYDDTKAGVDHTEVFELVCTEPGGVFTTDNVIAVDHDPRDFTSTVPEKAAYVVPTTPLDNKATWSGFKSDLVSFLVANRPLQI
jgi:hypothetical protein